MLGLVAPLSHAESASKGAVLLEVIDGETAFAVDQARGKAWWLVGECRREIPMPSGAKKSSQGVMQSQKMSEEVTLGRRQVVLEQQFRFNLTDANVTVEVYNSIRGGWAPIPVTLNAQCSLSAQCAARMDVPDC